MERENFLQKINRRAWFELRNKTRGELYLLTFRSYWHYLFNKSKSTQVNSTCFFAARPNVNAGIGHQMANWIAGLWFSRQFNLSFASIPFSNDTWDSFLGFGEGETQYYDLINKGYKVRRLPEFDENSQKELRLIKSIISTYSNSNTILLATQDQLYFDQFGISKELKDKFFTAPSRKFDNIKFSKEKLNIAVHVRRTVIIDNNVIEESEETKKRRWLSSNYYEKVLSQLLENIKTNKNIAIWIFSTGSNDEFVELKKYGEVHFCNDMDEYQTLLHLIYSDILVTSKSSFSYKPALINRGLKICPKNFWHGYPDSADWILCDNDGKFEVELLKEFSI